MHLHPTCEFVSGGKKCKFFWKILCKYQISDCLNLSVPIPQNGQTHTQTGKSRHIVSLFDHFAGLTFKGLTCRFQQLQMHI